ncbi:MAG: hypothetical protein ACOY7J_15040, partial [Pseudomonadota bacterium]
FSCLRTFEDDFLQACKSLAQAVLDNNERRFREAHTAMGFVANAKKFDWEFQWSMMRPLPRSGGSQGRTHPRLAVTAGTRVLDSG